MSDKTTVAVDAMGGDRAPEAVVHGAVEAVRRDPGLHVVLVGQEDPVHTELRSAGWEGATAGDSPAVGAISVVGASQVVGMGESPVEALRKKRDSSIAVAMGLVREKRAQAFVSAGNTGACVAAATLQLRVLPLVRKAGIAVAFYAGTHPVVVMDCGANVEAKPDHLVQYGVMASLYASKILGVANPRVGLLSIGEEDAKGNRLTKETGELFRSAKLNFIGNIEGNDVFRGICEVVVCDGFTGNIVLKVSEGLAERLVDLFKDTLREIASETKPLMDTVAAMLAGDSRGGVSRDGGGVGALLGKNGIEGYFKRSIGKMQQRIDYSEFGGAPLLGVNGAVTIAHGRSDAKAISSAIRVASRMASVDITGLIASNLEATAILD